jgi:V/A-type H+-transporting ATPase subunit C
MSAIADYAYLHCRVSICAEGLLSSQRMAELAACPPAQIAEILRDARFEGMAEELPATPRSLEQAVIDDYLQDIVVLMRPLKGAARAFLKHWAHRYEIINLKRCIRHQAAGLPPADLKKSLIDIGPVEELPLEELLRAENAEEVLRSLEGTPYADMARHARAVYEERHSLFDLEAVLDSQYYRGLFDRYKALSESDRQPLTNLLGALGDQVNLVWLLRYRFVFGLAPPHAYLLLIPSGRMLKHAQLLDLVQMEKMVDVLQSLPSPLVEEFGDASSIVEVEKGMDKRTQREAYRVLQHTQFNLARVIAYLALRERQILKVHAAIKGRILNLDEESIRIAARLPETFLDETAA